jgi:hypothetical protein
MSQHFREKRKTTSEITHIGLVTGSVTTQKSFAFFAKSAGTAGTAGTARTKALIYKASSCPTGRQSAGTVPGHHWDTCYIRVSGVETPRIHRPKVPGQPGQLGLLSCSWACPCSLEALRGLESDKCPYGLCPYALHTPLVYKAFRHLSAQVPYNLKVTSSLLTPMGTRCACCNLPEDTRAVVDQQLASGIARVEIRLWLLAQGHEISVQQLDNHKARHITPPETSSNLAAKTPEILGVPMSSAEAHKAVIQEHLKHCDRLISMTVRTPNLRAERLLSESLFRAHQMLSEVTFEADKTKGTHEP